MIDKADSITHQHLLSVLNTELKCFPLGKCIKILDVGCGDGHLIQYLQKNLNILNSDIEVEIYGFDVSDHGVQAEGYFEKTIEFLSEGFPDVLWEKRLRVFSAKELWPYSDDFFNVIVSNQVVEHVHDHDLFFSEINRTLCKGGVSVHLFPLMHCFYESHLNLPLVHKILNYDFMASYIKFLSRLGFGKFKQQGKSSSSTLDKYAERHADYMSFFTNYLSYYEILKMGKKYFFRVSFRYTQEFYTSKFRLMLGLKPHYKYKHNRNSISDWLALHVCKYISSVTLVIRKNEIYTRK